MVNFLSFPTQLVNKCEVALCCLPVVITMGVIFNYFITVTLILLLMGLLGRIFSCNPITTVKGKSRSIDLHIPSPDQ